MKVLIVGFRGKRESGKDALGSATSRFAQNAGFKVIRRGFGDALKEELAEFLCRYSYAEIFDFLQKHATPEWTEKILYQTFYKVPSTRWEKLKARSGFHPVEDFRGRYEEVLGLLHHRERKEQFRLIMQWWGTDYRRNQFDQKYWLIRLREFFEEKILENADHPLFLYAPDVRFPNEVEFTKEELRGFTVNILRPGHEPTDAHPSETALDDYTGFHHTFINDGTLKDLQAHGGVVFQEACTWKWGDRHGGSTSL